MPSSSTYARQSTRTRHLYDDTVYDPIHPMDEVVIMPTAARSSATEAYRLSSISFASHDYFFDSEHNSVSQDDEHEGLISTRFIPSDLEFFSSKDIQNEMQDGVERRELSYQNEETFDYPEPESFFSDFEDSDLELDEDIRSASPSICATARKVKITPLRAVRRSIRRSSLPEAYGTSFPSQRAATDHQQACAHNLSLDVFKRMFSQFRTNELLHPLSPTLSQSSSVSRSSVRPFEKFGDITIIELHDATQEAVYLAEAMSSKWKFEPAEEPNERSEGTMPPTLASSFFRRRSF